MVFFSIFWYIQSVFIKKFENLVFMTIEFGKWLVEKETAPICRYIKAITHERVKIPHCTRNKVVMLMFASVLDRAPTKVASEADISREKKCSICLGKYIINTLESILSIP